MAEEYKCQMCGGTFANQQELQSHVQQQHREPQPQQRQQQQRQQ